MKSTDSVHQTSTSTPENTGLERKQGKPKLRSPNQLTPEIAIRRMAFPEQSSKWARIIAHAWLCAWVVENNDKKFIYDSMVRRLQNLFATREAKSSVGKQPRFAFELLYPAMVPDRKFWTDAFRPLGGFTAMNIAQSAAELKTVRQSRANGLRSVATVMSIYHLFIHTGGSEIYQKRLKLSEACAFASKLLIARAPDSPSDETVRDHWRKRGYAAALIYAASLRSVGGTRLLMRLCSDPPIYKKDRTLRWLKLAKAISRKILEDDDFHNDDQLKFPAFPKTMQFTKIPAPSLRLCEAVWLIDRFLELAEKASNKRAERATNKRNEMPEVATIRLRIEKLYTGASCRQQRDEFASQQSDPPPDCPACGRFTGKFDQDLKPILTPAR